jgi:hypothetical protein
VSSLTTAAEVAIWSLFFNGTYWPGIAQRDTSAIAATQFWISLHNSNPTETGSQNSFETSYGGYARVPVPRVAGQWLISGGNPVLAMNANPITFPSCNTQGDTLAYWGLGSLASGAGNLFLSGPITNLSMYDFTAVVGDPGVLTVPGAGIAVGTPVAFYSLGPLQQLPLGVTEGVQYYVAAVVGSSITLTYDAALTEPVTLGSAGAGIILPCAPMIVVPQGQSGANTPSFPANALTAYLN